MRPLGWICGCLLLAACSVRPVLEVDASGGAGHDGGGGAAGAGGAAGGADGGVGGTGGGGGGGGGDGEDCTQLEADYARAFADARMCDPGATGQCQLTASTSLSCPGCMVRVTDRSALDAIAAKYQRAGCNSPPHPCPAIACVIPGDGGCVATNSGDTCL